MSANAVAWAWERPEVGQNELLLLVYLADSADRYGYCGNLQRVLSDAGEVLGMSTGTVMRYFKALKARKLLKVLDGAYELAVAVVGERASWLGGVGRDGGRRGERPESRRTSLARGEARG